MPYPARQEMGFGDGHLAPLLALKLGVIAACN